MTKRRPLILRAANAPDPRLLAAALGPLLAERLKQEQAAEPGVKSEITAGRTGGYTRFPNGNKQPSQ